MTKDEMQEQIDRLHMLLGMAFMLLPASKRKVFFESTKDLRKIQ